MYTCLFEAYDHGNTCFDPLIFHYPIGELYKTVEASYIVGDALKVSPKLQAGNDSFDSYFPDGSWVSMQNYSDVIVVNSDEGAGKYVKLDATLPTVNVHLRPGHMIVKQNNND